MEKGYSGEEKRSERVPFWFEPGLSTTPAISAETPGETRRPWGE